MPERIFEPAITVADCFKFRNTVGLEAALEEIRDEGWRDQITNLDPAEAPGVLPVVAPNLATAERDNRVESIHDAEEKEGHRLACRQDCIGVCRPVTPGTLHLRCSSVPGTHLYN